MSALDQTQTTLRPRFGALLDRAFAVAAMQRSENTRRAYASTYRSFCAFLSVEGAPVVEDDLTVAALRSYCDLLERRGRSQTTVARHLSALRSLAAELGLADALTEQLGGERPRARRPVVLADAEYELLASGPDARTARGKRDLAIIRLLGDCGLRRSELCALGCRDVVRVENCLTALPLLRAEERTCYELAVRRDKTDAERRVPLTKGALEALFAWRLAQPTSSNAQLFVSVREPAAALSDRMVTKIVRKYAERVELTTEGVNPQALRHSYCARLARRGATAQQIAALAGHTDIRTARVYTDDLAVA